jgi:hypothetical protein
VTDREKLWLRIPEKKFLHEHEKKQNIVLVYKLEYFNADATRELERLSMAIFSDNCERG